MTSDCSMVWNMRVAKNLMSFDDETMAELSIASEGGPYKFLGKDQVHQAQHAVSGRDCLSVPMCASKSKQSTSRCLPWNW